MPISRLLARSPATFCEDHFQPFSDLTRAVVLNILTDFIRKWPECSFSDYQTHSKPTIFSMNI